MKLFGEDPEISRQLRRELGGLQVDLGVARREIELASEREKSLLSAIEGLKKENGDLKRAAMKNRVRDPFADFPADLRAQIDYKALGYEEPD